MTTWSTSRSGAIVMFGVLAIMELALLLLIATNGQSLQPERSIAASLLILGAMLFGVGGYLFAGRAFLKWPVGETPNYLLWERGFIIAAVLVNGPGAGAVGRHSR